MIGQSGQVAANEETAAPAPPIKRRNLFPPSQALYFAFPRTITPLPEEPTSHARG